MKTISVVFLILVIFFSSSAAAFSLDKLSFFGEVGITTIRIPNINNKISEINHTLELGDNEGHKTEQLGINSLFGFNLGAFYSLTPNLSLGAEYERFFGGDNWFMEHGYTGFKIEEDWVFNLNGFLGLIQYNFFDFLGLRGGIGYYFGSHSINRKENGEERTYEVDLEGSFGLKLGGEITYNFTENWGIKTTGHYRHLIMDIKDNDNYYEGYFEEDNFSGFDLKAGIKYSF